MRHSKQPISIDGPNVEEIRRIRAKLSKRFDNDLGKLCEHLRQIETQYRDRVVQPRRETPCHNATPRTGLPEVAVAVDAGILEGLSQGLPLASNVPERARVVRGKRLMARVSSDLVRACEGALKPVRVSGPGAGAEKLLNHRARKLIALGGFPADQPQ